MFVLSCEAATCAVPEWHKEVFRGREELLTSTAGWAPGALNLAQGFATKLRMLLAHGEITRLLVDLSRHPTDPNRLGPCAENLTPDQRQKLEERSYLPFVNAIKQRVRAETQRGGPCLHLSLTTEDIPVAVRILHSGQREEEIRIATVWKEQLRTASPDLMVETGMEPDPGLSRHLREVFPAPFSSLRVVATSSAFLEGKPIRWEALKKLLIQTLPRPA